MCLVVPSLSTLCCFLPPTLPFAPLLSNLPTHSYDLLKLLGTGSFSAVVLARDRSDGTLVALKRVADVLSSRDAARKVLREVCILRRVAHPAVVWLRAAFVRPGTRGPFVMGADGCLHSSTLDAYIAMEYCDGDDLFSLRGQLAAGEVQSLMFQIASALAHLHARGVAHRDVKSANVLVTRAPDGSGRLLAKLADFGSARSVGVVCEGDEGETNHPAAVTLHHTDSFANDDRATTATRADISACPAATEGGGFRPPLTRVVATPCYRAPEVVMSRGGYTAVMDVWSLGCVFGELLQRVRRVGDAATPALRVAPLFAVRGLPTTPVSGGGGVTPATELDALFDVIGTPSWADIAAVSSRPWRRHLSALRHRAPRLARTLGGGADEVALSLLARMLAFDPARRPSAAEVLTHEYFAEGEDGEEAEEDAAAAAHALAPPPHTHTSPPGSPSPGKRPRHYYDEPDPARALALLEEEADRACAAAAAVTSPSHGPPSPHPAQTDAARRTEPGVAVLCALLEAECASLAAACRERGAQPLPDAAAPPRRRGRSHGRPPRPPTHPQEDTRGRGDDDGGRDRLARVADAARGAALDPKDFLTPGRHGEWSGGCEGAPGPAAGPYAWGVSVLPPGVEDEGVADAVRRQQRR